MPKKDKKIETEEEGEDAPVEEMKSEDKGFFASIISLFKGLRPGTQMEDKQESFSASMVDSSSGIEWVRKSLLDHVDYLVKAQKSKDGLERILNLTKFQIGSVRLTEKLRKPLNPILGEVCYGRSRHDDGSNTYMIAEQVSHHPPISAFYLVNDQHELEFDPNWSKGKAVFWGKHLQISIEGTKRLAFKKFDESYDMVLPDFYIRIFRGAAEYCGKSTITCKKTGYISKISYKAKPLFGGKWHALKGKIYHESDPKKILISFEGTWDNDVTFTNTQTNSSEVVDYKNGIHGKWENPQHSDEKASENVWGPFKDSVKRGNLNEANKAKTEVEEAQRDRRKKGTDFSPRFFAQKDKDWTFVGTLPEFLK